jgi:hypothetical protein
MFTSRMRNFVAFYVFLKLVNVVSILFVAVRVSNLSQPIVTMSIIVSLTNRLELDSLSDHFLVSLRAL